MSDLVEELAEQGRHLSPEDRVRLLDLLLESLDEGAPSKSDDTSKAEIERRVARYERDDATLHDADDVMAEAKHIAS